MKLKTENLSRYLWTKNAPKYPISIYLLDISNLVCKSKCSFVVWKWKYNLNFLQTPMKCWCLQCLLIYFTGRKIYHLPSIKYSEYIYYGVSGSSPKLVSLSLHGAVFVQLHCFEVVHTILGDSVWSLHKKQIGKKKNPNFECPSSIWRVFQCAWI